MTEMIAISGRSRFAIKSYGDKYMVLDGRDDLNWTPINPLEASRLIDCCDDLQWIQTCDDQQTISELAVAVARTTALDMLLFVFDSGLTLNVRQSAANELEQLLQHHGVEQFLEDLFFSKPLPDNVEHVTPLQVVESGPANVKRIVRSIIELQSTIRRVRNAWESIPFHIHMLNKAPSEFEAHCLRLGLFRRAVLASHSISDLNNLQITISNDGCLTVEFPEVSKLISSWFGPLYLGVE